MNEHEGMNASCMNLAACLPMVLHAKAKRIVQNSMTFHCGINQSDSVLLRTCINKLCDGHSLALAFKDFHDSIDEASIFTLLKR